MWQTYRSAFGPLDLGIVALALATAVIHAVLAVLDARLPFAFNALGYLVLLAALYAPLATLTGRRGRLRWTLIAYTLLTLLLWVLRGDRTPIAYADKAIELGLLALLWLRRPREVTVEPATTDGSRVAA